MRFKDDFEKGGNDQNDMKRALLDWTQKDRFDYVFTHSRRRDNGGYQGEYGNHANHREVQEMVTSLVKEGDLAKHSNRVAYFAYKPMYEVGGSATVAVTAAKYYVQLTYEELLHKCEWCGKVPDLGNLENIGFPCPNPEAFEGDALEMPRNLCIQGFIAKTP